MGCTPQGKHGDLLGYKFLDTLHPYTEIAFNGNDMDHPQLIPFLNKLKEKKVYANMTVNQKQFLDNYELIKTMAEDKLIYGIGVSFSNYNKDFIDKIKEFKNAVIHVINGMIKLSDLKISRYCGGSFCGISCLISYKHVVRAYSVCVTGIGAQEDVAAT